MSRANREMPRLAVAVVCVVVAVSVSLACVLLRRPDLPPKVSTLWIEECLTPECWAKHSSSDFTDE